MLAAVEPEGGIESVVSRLNEKFKDYNRQNAESYELSISIGFATLNPEGKHSIEDCMAHADEAMYDNKRKRNKKSPLREIGKETLAETLA